jgi:hypothetical protein
VKLDLEMVEEMETLLIEAMTHIGTKQGRAALEKAAHLWRCYADSMRAGIACVPSPGVRQLASLIGLRTAPSSYNRRLGSIYPVKGG